MNLAHWLARAAAAEGGRPALGLGGRVVADYATLGARAARLAGGLAALGLAPGARVAIVAKNVPDYVELLFGLWHGGFAAIPINVKLHPAEIGWMLEHAGAAACFVTADMETAVAAAAPASLRHLIRVGGAEHERLRRADPVAVAAVGPDALAWLFYTSGTTGRPKGAMLTHRNLAAMSLAYLADVDPTRPGEPLLHAAPMSHGSGLYVLGNLLALGVNVVPESAGFEPDEIFALARAWPGLSLFAAPTMIKRLVAAEADVDPVLFRTVVWGGAPMHVADTLRALDRFGPRFAQIYGQGETPMTTTVLPKWMIADRDHPRFLDRLGSAGFRAAPVEVIVADAEDRPLPVGETGEILVRGETVMAGYLGDEAATARALRGGWLHTGDVGAFDAEGFLTLKDRSKDLVISGGSNIYPREVEEVLLTHPGVREVSVIGRPDPEWGEVVVAYVVGSATPEDLDRLCLDRIARFKRPKDYVHVDQLPKNAYGKILKTELRAADAKRREGEGAS